MSSKKSLSKSHNGPYCSEMASFNIVDQEHKTTSRFSNSIEFILSALGYAVGYGNIWRFPYMLFRNGGGIFLIPFTISIFVIIFPLSYVETAYGQMYRYEIHKYYDFVNPRLLGMSFGISAILFFISVYYM